MKNDRFVLKTFIFAIIIALWPGEASSRSHVRDAGVLSSNPRHIIIFSILDVREAAKLPWAGGGGGRGAPNCLFVSL
jgi:hypothetical protein